MSGCTATQAVRFADARCDAARSIDANPRKARITQLVPVLAVLVTAMSTIGCATSNAAPSRSTRAPTDYLPAHEPMTLTTSDGQTVGADRIAIGDRIEMGPSVDAGDGVDVGLGPGWSTEEGLDFSEDRRTSPTPLPPHDLEEDREAANDRPLGPRR